MHTWESWFLLAFGAWFAGLSAWDLGRGLLTLRWPAVSGRVLETGARHWPGFRSGYAPTVRYAYEVAGRQLDGSRLRFGPQALRGSERKARQALGGLAPGAEVVIYYNPRRPGDAVLRQGVTRGTLWFLLVGAFLITIGLRS